MCEESINWVVNSTILRILTWVLETNPSREELINIIRLIEIEESIIENWADRLFQEFTLRNQ